MTYLAVCALIAFLTGIPCALFVFLNKPRTITKLMWSLYSLGISLWGLGIFQFLVTKNPDTVLIISRCINHSSIFISIFFLHFTLLLTGLYEQKKRELYFYYGIFVVYSVITLAYPSTFIRSLSAKGGFNLYPDAGILYYVVPILFLYMWVYGLVILYRSAKQASAIKRNQFLYLFYSSLIGIGGGCTTLFLIFDIPIFPYGAIMVPLYNLAVAYIIVKHQLMDIRIIIRKSVVYTVLLTVLMVLYMASIYVLERSFSHIIGYRSAMGSSAVFVVLAIIFVPLKNWIQSFLDKHFFKASYLQIVEQNDLLRQQVSRSERYKNMAALSQNIITELRSPLTALVGYGYQLPKRLDDKEFLNKFIQVFDKEIDRIQALVKRLSDFSSSKPLDLKPVNITALMQESLDSVADLLVHKKIVLYKFYAEKADVKVMLDETQMKQALYYFLISVIKYMPENGGQIWIGMSEVNDAWEISIKDTGKGLTTEELTKVFDPSFTQQQDEVVVFGLSMAQNIINNHGGKVIVDSEPGVGTEWVIQLTGLSRLG